MSQSMIEEDRSKYYNKYIKPQQQRPTAPYYPRPRQPEPAAYEPLRLVDETYVNDLFTAINTGDINEIKKAASDRNITYNLVNTDKETPIHVILRNNFVNLTESQKLDLIKFFVDNGVSQFAVDKRNITALHLAAKYQYATI